MQKLITINCSNCDKAFEKYSGEINRQRKKGRNNFYCSKECCCAGVSKLNKQFPDKIKQCEWCKVDFVTSDAKHANKCCSKKCAVNITAKFNTKLPESKFPKKRHIPKPISCVCCVCALVFSTTNFKKQTCSKKCMSELMSQKARANPNCGGQTNYKKFQYKSIWMDSSWEVEIAEWLDSKGIEWVRTKKIYFNWTDSNGKERLYFPDFYLPELDMYLDPKNKFLETKDKFKIEQVIENYKINLIYGDKEKIKNAVNNCENALLSV